MSFHRSHVLNTLVGKPWSKSARIGQFDFPARTDLPLEDKVAALEQAMIAIHESFVRLSAEVERIDQTVAARLSG